MSAASEHLTPGPAPTGPPRLAAAGTARILRGLLWQEWRAHGGMVSWALAMWFVCTWVLELFEHPGWVLGTGLIYAILIASRTAGSDAVDGTEELSLSLPPTRGLRYLVRLVVGAVPLVAMVLLGLAALGGQWPQKLWGLVIESGLTKPFDPTKGPLAALAIGVPLAAFGITFSLAANGTRAVVLVTWLFASACAASVALVGMSLEKFLELWPEVGEYRWPHGSIAMVFLLAVAAGSLVAGYVAYVRRGMVMARGLGGWASRLVLILLGAAAIALVLLVSA